MNTCKTVLLVDDDFTLARLMKDAIIDMGYAVELAHSGLDAEDLIRDGVQVDLLLTDINLGKGFNGFELARRARTIHPDLPVLYMSGDAQRTETEMGEVQALVLQKPVFPDDLESALNNAVGSDVGGTT
jgi:CheY-like chemotaxis protein